MLEQQTQSGDGQGAEKLIAYTLQQIQAGADRAMISQNLVSMGAKQEDIDPFLDSLYEKIRVAAEARQFSGPACLGGLLGGIGASIISGILWGLLAVKSGYEVGYAAWGIGLLTGFAVLIFSGGRRGLPLQMVSAGCSFIGVALGKYMVFYYAAKEIVLAQPGGAEAAANMTPISPAAVAFFIQNLNAMLTPYDLLWVFLAVYTAWRMLR